MSSDRSRVLARRWLAKARTDLAVASVVLEQGPDMDPWAACFHAQQAAEKAMKAVMIAAGMQPPQVHDLRALRAQLPSDLHLDATDADLSQLTMYATGTRYLFDAALGVEDPTWDEATRAAVVAAAIERAVRAYLGFGTA